MISRWRFYASVAVLGFACLAYFWAGTIEWGDRQAMVGTDSAETAEQARFVVELYGLGAVNVLAVIVFVLRQSNPWPVFGIQGGIFAFALVELLVADRGDIGWFFVGVLPLLTSFLLFAFGKSAQRKPRMSDPPLVPNAGPHRV